MKLAENTDNLEEDRGDILLLFNDPLAFKSDIFLSVTGEVPKAKNVKLTGRFMTKVFDGPYREIPTFIKQMKAYLKDQHEKAKKYYVHYAYCPKCAEEKGHNYMVFFAELK